ncbi:hypothetical protein DVH24_009076 [Malus domestica]|uniref:Uncharacterized protein n=1 Tax=Malus domestica TaxID=3750 RepID=A0A498JSP6_MALDO|nr:hypothetical protein DVH24_009076 [Malus domestica]
MIMPNHLFLTLPIYFIIFNLLIIVPSPIPDDNFLYAKMITDTPSAAATTTAASSKASPTPSRPPAAALNTAAAKTTSSPAEKINTLS